MSTKAWALPGALTTVFGLAWWMTVVTLTQHMRCLLARPRSRRILDGVTGIVLIALGLQLLRTPPSDAAA